MNTLTIIAILGLASLAAAANPNLPPAYQPNGRPAVTEDQQMGADPGAFVDGERQVADELEFVRGEEYCGSAFLDADGFEGY